MLHQTLSLFSTINYQTSIVKQSNHNWNMLIYLKNNGPHIKVPLISWFLIMTFKLCFYNQLWVKWVCIHIGNNSGHIEQTHLRFPKYLWMFETQWNAHQNAQQLHEHVLNTSTWSKKKSSTVYSTFDNLVYLNRNFHLLEI